MLLETFFPLLLCLENDSTAHADLALLEIPGPSKPQSKGSGALMEAKSGPSLAVSWHDSGWMGASYFVGPAVWAWASCSSWTCLPEHPASISLGPASSLAPKQDSNHRKSVGFRVKLGFGSGFVSLPDGQFWTDDFTSASFGSFYG